jgi:hypothetical protein
MSWKKLVNLISLLILEEGLGKIGLKEVGATAMMLKIPISDEMFTHSSVVQTSVEVTESSLFWKR